MLLHRDTPRGCIILLKLQPFLACLHVLVIKFYMFAVMSEIGKFCTMSILNVTIKK